jgi:phage terminase large subunit-like protein
MSTAAEELAEVIDEYRDAHETRKVEFFEPYAWQKEMVSATGTDRQIYVMAANRVGKTFGAAALVATVATGMYPDWWDGIRFPPGMNLTVWALGYSSETLRDIVQNELVGTPDENWKFSGSMIPKHMIKDAVSSGYPRLAKTVFIRQKGNGLTKLSFKAYAQGPEVMMGSSVHLIWIDEEPEDRRIFPQCVTRTTNTQGVVLVTATPELGVTELVRQFMQERKEGQRLIQATWADAPHLDEATKNQILAALPDYERDLRSKGVPILGEGRVFPISEDAIICEPFELPAHYRKLVGIDFGWTHPTAAAFVAYDPDRDTIFIYDEYRKTDALPAVHAAAIRARGNDIQVVYPRDAFQTEKGTGKQVADYYREAGLELNIQFKNPDGSISIEPGLLDMYQRMQTGRLKVFSHCTQWLEEFRVYHRKDGKLVQKHDDLMDASRYACVCVPRYGAVGGNMHSQRIDSYAPDLGL